MTQILPETYNEDIKLDHHFIGYFIFNWGKKKRKKTQKPTSLHIWPSDEFLVLRDSFFPYLKICINTVKTGHAWWRISKSQSWAQLRASPTVLCQGSRDWPGLALRALPASACHQVKDSVLLTHSESFLTRRTLNWEPGFTSLISFPAQSLMVEGGVGLFSCTVTSRHQNCCHSTGRR